MTSDSEQQGVEYRAMLWRIPMPRSPSGPMKRGWLLRSLRMLISYDVDDMVQQWGWWQEAILMGKRQFWALRQNQTRKTEW